VVVVADRLDYLSPEQAARLAAPVAPYGGAPVGGAPYAAAGPAPLHQYQTGACQQLLFSCLVDLSDA
jgi:hypothetical protein